jgi:hypothetical protein
VGIFFSLSLFARRCGRWQHEANGGCAHFALFYNKCASAKNGLRPTRPTALFLLFFGPIPIQTTNTKRQATKGRLSATTMTTTNQSTPTLAIIPIRPTTRNALAERNFEKKEKQ